MFKEIILILFIIFFSSSSFANNNSVWLEKNKKGMEYYKLGDYVSSEKYYLEAIKEAESQDLKAELSATLNNLGLLHSETLRIESSKNLLEKSLRIRLEIYGGNHRYVAQSYNNLARAYETNDEYEKSIDLYVKSLKVYESLGERYKMLLARTLNNLSTVQIKIGLLDVAEKNLVRSMAISKEYSNDNSIFLTAMSNLASIFSNTGKYIEAEKLYMNLLNISLEIENSDSIKLARLYNNLAVVMKKQCNYNNALNYIEKSLNIWNKNKGIFILDYSSALHNYGELYKALGKFDLAEKNILNSLKVLEDNDIKYNDQYLLQSFSLINLYKQLDQYNRISEILNKINSYRISQQLTTIDINEVPEGVYEHCSSSNI